MGLCRPFKTFIENSSIPVDESIGNVAVKEVVMSELVEMIIETIDNVREITERLTTPDLFGSFTYNDCVIFGGDIAGASSSIINWVLMILQTIICYYIFKNQVNTKSSI